MPRLRVTYVALALLTILVGLIVPGDTVAHVTPPLLGKVSVITTLLAVPWPVLVTTMVNVAVWPALIGGAPTSGDLAIASTGARHVI